MSLFSPYSNRAPFPARNSNLIRAVKFYASTLSSLFRRGLEARARLVHPKHGGVLSWEQSAQQAARPCTGTNTPSPSATSLPGILGDSRRLRHKERMGIFNQIPLFPPDPGASSTRTPRQSCCHPQLLPVATSYHRAWL